MFPRVGLRWQSAIYLTHIKDRLAFIGLTKRLESRREVQNKHAAA
jgi:hypothetical protein